LTNATKTLKPYKSADNDDNDCNNRINAITTRVFQGHAESGRQSGLGRGGRLPDVAQNVRAGLASSTDLQVLAPGHAAHFPGRRASRGRLSDGFAKQTVELFVGTSRAETHAGAGQRLYNSFSSFPRGA
jgi:hypothetical protein